MGTPVWVELAGSDLDASAAFYGEVFGWTRAPYNPGTFDFSLGELEVGGLLQKDRDVADAWMVYLKVVDIRATLLAARDAGGRVLQEPVREGGHGVWALLEDPTGAAIGVWQPESFPGFESHGIPGAPCWFELHSKNFEVDVSFYQRVFGAPTTPIGDADDVRMVALGPLNPAYAGIYDARDDELTSESSWVSYFTVADADHTASVVRAAGGVLLDGPTDTFFGRRAHARDVTGALFSFLELPARP